MRFILGLFALLFIRPIFYLLKGLWFVLEFCFMILVVKMILNRTRDDQLDRLSGEKFISERLNVHWT